MDKSNTASTKDIHTTGFAPHGTMQLVIQDRLNVIEAEGPFNLELVIAGDAAQELLDTQLQAKGHWGTILIFRKNALASFEVLAEIESILKRRKEKGIFPAGVAIVMSPEVEGASLMSAFYLRAYTNAGILTRVFENQNAAQDWLLPIVLAGE
jgi:hypothetical protein